MSSVNENAHRTPWRLLWSDILILLSSRKEKEDVRPVGLVYGKHASRFRIPRDKHEQRATANWNAWKHLRRPTALLAPAPAAAAVVPVQDVTTVSREQGPWAALRGGAATSPRRTVLGYRERGCGGCILRSCIPGSGER